jgi:zinc protease
MMRILIIVVWTLFANAVQAADIKLEALTSPHGIHFSYVRSDVQSTVALSIGFKGGIASDDPKSPVTGYLVPSLIGLGAGGKTDAELYEAFQDFGGQYTLSADADRTYGNLSAPVKGILGAAKLANLVLTQPDFPEKKLREQREAIARSIRENLSYAETKSYVAFANAIIEPHPYDYYMKPAPELFNAVTREDLKLWTKRHITLDGISVALVGDVSAEEAGAIVDAMLQGLPSKSDLPEAKPVVFKPIPKEPIRIAAETGDQVVIKIGSAFVTKPTLAEWQATSMLINSFGGDQKSRLFKDIREVSGATYGLQSSVDMLELLSTNQVSGRISKAGAEDTIALVKKSWDRFREEGPTAEEISNAKSARAQGYKDAQRNHTQFANVIRNYLVNGLSNEDFINAPKTLEAVDLKDKALLAKLYPPNPIIVVAQ